VAPNRDACFAMARVEDEETPRFFDLASDVWEAPSPASIAALLRAGYSLNRVEGGERPSPLRYPPPRCRH
jgi:hypothetical protein